MNYSLFEGNEIIVTPSIPFTNRNKKELNLFVRGLPPGTTSKLLHEIISNHCKEGRIVSCKVGRDKDNKTLSYGYVNFEKTSESTVSKLVDEKSFLYASSTIEIFPYTKSKMESSNIYMKNFPKEFKTKKEVIAFVEGYKVEIKSSFIPSKQDSTELIGFGFVDFGTYEKSVEFFTKVFGKTTEEVKNKLSSDEPGYTLDSNKIYIGKALSRAERSKQLLKKTNEYKKQRKALTKDKNLYVNNFPADYDDSKLKELFGKYGEITSSKVMLDDEKKSKGFGFVCFTNTEDARKAIEEMKTNLVAGKQLNVNIAQSKAQRKRELENQRKGNFYPSMYPQMINQGMPPFMQYPMGPRPPLSGRQPYPPMQQARPPMYPPPPHQPNYYPQAGMIPPPQQMQANAPRKENYSAMIQGKSPEDAKETLGEIIYNLALQENKNFAPKITGMLLELETEEIIFNLSNDRMKGKIHEALEVLNSQ